MSNQLEKKVVGGRPKRSRSFGIQIFMTLVMLLSMTAMVQGPVSAQGSDTHNEWGYPYCTGANPDPEGDGWGWENNESCVVRADAVAPVVEEAVEQVVEQTVEEPVAQETSSETHNEWGYPYCTGANPDPEGDGWGWENNASCVVNPNTPAETPAEESDPGIGIAPEGESLAIDSLRELKNADLPDWAKADLLTDLGHQSVVSLTVNGDFKIYWDRISSAEMDKQLDATSIFDLSTIAESESPDFVPTPDESLSATDRAAKFRCPKWYDKEKSFDISLLGDHSLSADQGITDDLTVSWEGSVGMDGEINVSGTVYYRSKKNRCTGVTYRYELKYADIDIIATIDGSMEVSNTFTIEYKKRLWEQVLQIMPEKKVTLIVAGAFSVSAKLEAEVVMALDLQATASITQTGVVNQDYVIDGEYISYLTCVNGEGCSARDGEQGSSDFVFTQVDRNENSYQRTLDIVITPSVELRLKMQVDVRAFDIRLAVLFRARAGIIAKVPIRVFWTEGNACSDANGDGINERVSTMLIDINAELSAYLSAQVRGGPENVKWVELRAGNGWLGEQAVQAVREGLPVNRNVPILSKNLYTSIIEGEDASAVQMVVNNAGKFNVNGQQREGIEIAGPRDCYPFNDIPSFMVDWGDGTSKQYDWFPGSNNVITHDWADDGRNRTVRVRIVEDSAGRDIDGTWVNVDIDENSNIAPEVVLPVSVDGFPICDSSASDPDGDGYGWENGQTCQVHPDSSNPDTNVQPTHDAFGFPYCEDASSDPDGDGYGWENNATCSVRPGGSVASETDLPTHNEWGYPYCVGADADPDGDGWGWENNESCQVRPAGQSTQSQTRAIVTMGDSFISGEAGRWMGNSKSSNRNANGTDRGREVYTANGCHRSDVAPVHSANIGGLVPINLACSGARSWHVRNTSWEGQEPQMDSLATAAANHDIEMIVLSIGGNDLGFPEIISGCISAYALGGDSCVDAGIEAKIADVQADIRATIDEIQDTMTAAGDTDYRLVLQGYVSPVPRSSEIRYNEGWHDWTNDRIASGCGFYDTDLDWARDVLVPAIDEAWRETADNADIEYLALRDAFQGKEVCSNGTKHASSGEQATEPTVQANLEWVRWAGVEGAIQGDTPELMHPNALGQQALGKCLGLLYETTGTDFHACERTGKMPTDMKISDYWTTYFG